MNDLRYPIGRFVPDPNPTPETRNRHIEQISGTPACLRRGVAGLTTDQLHTPYRDGGWTVQQVVHHLPDSHLNAYIRFKWAMTEDAPTIKPYDEGAWAALKDSELTPVDVSLTLLESLHARGRCCCGLSSQKTFNAGSLTLTLARTILTGCSAFIAGTATTMWRTLRACVSGWAGKAEQLASGNWQIAVSS